MAEDVLLKIETKQIEYQRQHLWIIEFNGIDSWLAQSAARPTMSLGGTKQINYINTYVKFQEGRGVWNSINITLNDPINNSASLALYEWIMTQWNYETGKATYKNQYAKDLTIKLLDPNGVVTETWILHNAFLTGDVNFDAAGLDYDNTDRLRVSFTLDYDWATLLKT